MHACMHACMYAWIVETKQKTTPSSSFVKIFVLRGIPFCSPLSDW